MAIGPVGNAHLKQVGNSAMMELVRRSFMSNIVQKDSRNRVSLGSDVQDTHFTRDIDPEGRIIFTPCVLVPKNEYEEYREHIVLNDSDRDNFIAALLNRPARNTAFAKAKKAFQKKYK